MIPLVLALAIDLAVADGKASIEVLSDSTFRFARVWSGELPGAALSATEGLAVTRHDTADAVVLTTKDIRITIAKRDLRLTVETADGKPVMEDAMPVARDRGRIQFTRTVAGDERFYGLGARDGAFNLVGTRAVALRPFLVSSSGYGEYHAAAGRYTYDFKDGRYTIESTAAAIDLYFMFGPEPKGVLEQFNALNTPVTRQAFLPWNPNERVKLLNAAMSGPWGRPLSCPMLPTSPSYFAVYNEEARDRGLPFAHPLAMQFPRDPVAANRTSEFMCGDELLYAATEETYLPQGAWTNLATDQTHGGRRLIATKPGEWFARNGTIVPVSDKPRQLHYFPKLGAEFFFFEPEVNDYSQVHAAPAGILMRLEIESKVARDYEWIVHHTDRPKRVEALGHDLPAAAWSYDAARRQLRMRRSVAAGGGDIVNIY